MLPRVSPRSTNGTFGGMEASTAGRHSGSRARVCLAFQYLFIASFTLVKGLLATSLLLC